MTPATEAPRPAKPAPTDRTDPPTWTCPFCALLCDGLRSPAEAAALCPRARAGIDALAPPRSADRARIDGREAAPEDALALAAQRLASWRQPLFGGLGTDVAGARALYRLAARTGAILDHAGGEALMQGLRAVQDRGQYIATLGELHARAHTLVCVGTDAVANFPRFFDRIGAGREGGPLQRIVFLGVAPPAGLLAHATVQHLPGSGDLHADLQQLAALVTRQRPTRRDPALAALADTLLASPYSVLLWEGGTLPPQGALIVEGLNRIVGTLNLATRAATFGLGGSDGAASVNQTVTWLSGLPLRTRVAAAGLQHDPHRFGSARLLAGAGADGLLWVASFDPALTPPATDLPCIVLGPPAMATRLTGPGIFLPVATPGVNADAHLFRTDGPVLLPLAAARDDGLMTVAQVATALLQALEAPP